MGWLSYPKQSDNRIGKYTDFQMKLFQELVKLGLPCLLEYPVVREGEFTKDGKQKGYSIDILVGKWLAVEVEGKGSSSADNDERDEYLSMHKFRTLHIPNADIKSDAPSVASMVKQIYEAGQQ